MSRLLAAAVAMLVVGVAAPAAASVATPAGDSGTIEIGADVPPGADVVVRLLDADGVDVFDDFCARDDVGYAGSLPGWRCAGVPAGDYLIELGPLPDDYRVQPVDCLLNGIVESAPEVSIGTGEGQNLNWICGFAATPPAVMIVSDDGGELAGRPVLVAGDGTEIGLDCVPDLRVPTPAAWCMPIDDGAYTVAFADGEARFFCDPELHASSYSDEFGSSIEITDERWFWSCTAAEPASATDPAPIAQTGTIQISAGVPPGVDIEVRLLDEAGDDVLGKYCIETLEGYAQSLPGWRCGNVPLGVYEVELGEVPDGYRVLPVDCRLNGQVEDAPEAVLGIGEGQGTNQVCAFIATPPVVILAFEDWDGVAPDAELVLHDAAGERVEAECVPDDRGVVPASWCFPLADGAYTAELVDVPDGYAQEIWCDPELDAGGFSSQWGPVVELGERWFWSCTASIVPQIRIVFQGESLANVGAATYTIEGVDGALDLDLCRLVDSPQADEYFGDDFGRLIHCVGVPNGSYRVSPIGPGLAEWQDCIADVGPGFWGSCDFYVEGRPEIVPETPAAPVATPPTPSSPPTSSPPTDSTDVATTPAASSADPPDASSADDSDGSNSNWIWGGLGGLVVGLIVGGLLTSRFRPRPEATPRVP